MRDGFRGPPTVVVVAVVAVIQLVGTFFAAARQRELRDLDLLAVLLLLAGPALLSLRRRLPGPMAAGVTAVTLAYFALGYPWGPVVLSLAFSLIFASVARARVWVLASAAAAILAVGIWAVRGGELGLVRGAAVSGWLLLLVLLGEGLRARSEYLAQRQAQRQAEKQRAKDEERLALARDIHDVVAHSLSMINVRASVALHLADSKPEELKPALEAIKEASKDALTDVRQLLGVLRQDAPTNPAAALDQLPALVERARAAGLDVDVRVEGTDELPPATQAVLYRTIQEALTNTIRHAGARHVRLRLARKGEGVALEVRDDGVGLRGAPPGNGLRGMRERVAAAGGELTITDDGGVGIAVRLPASRGGAR